MSEISNHWLKTQIQKRLETLSFEERVFFKNLRICGSVLMRSSALCGAVVESNGKDSRYIGLSHCQNAWLCPECSARVMAKQGKLIGSALDYAADNNLVAFMGTFTIGHNYFLTASEVINALYDSWTACWNCKNQAQRKNNIFRRFYEQCQIKHFIKACEITYSTKRGWHPHFHILFFVPKKLQQKALEFEEELGEYWQTICLKRLKKEIAKRTEHKLKESYVEEIYNQKTATSKGVHFSKNEKGEIFAVDSPSYVIGWNAQSELTGSSYKTETKSEFSMTLNQLMEAAIEDSNETAWQKYMELARAVYRKRARVAWSHTGLKKAAMQNMDKYETIFKKKNIVEEKKQPFQVVCFIPSKLWLRICRIDTEFIIRNLILQFAIYDNGFSLISELLKTYNLPEPLRIYQNAEQKIEAAA